MNINFRIHIQVKNFLLPKLVITTRDRYKVYGKKIIILLNMEQLKRIGRYILRKFSKIQLAIIVVLIICCFVIGDSNIFSRFGYDLEIHNLKTQIEYYQEKTETDKRKLNELRSDKDNIEKFARENYLMKKEDEEVFIIE